MAVVNAENCVAGRLASLVAKRLLNGEEIIIVNAEKAVINGNPGAIEKLFRKKTERGDPYHGPFYPKKSDTILRRIIRGMLPHRKPRGRDAYKRLKVYKSLPEEFAKEQAEIISKAKGKFECKYVYLNDVVKKISG